jgi:hypothetical protein
MGQGQTRAPQQFTTVDGQGISPALHLNGGHGELPGP